MVAYRDIIALVDQIAREFKPHKIILFGSYAYGTPSEDSDVDLMVIMPFRGREIDKAVEISSAVGHPFAMDLLVRKPAAVRQRLKLNDFFLMDITEQGLTLYDETDTGVGSKGRRRLRQRIARLSGKKGPELRRRVLSRSTVR